MVSSVCGKCGKVITTDNYGGYAVPRMVELCSACWQEYIELKQKQDQENKQFWGDKQ